MRELTLEKQEEIRNTVMEYLSEEMEVNRDEITDELRLIEDLDGDSLMFVELVQVLKEKYGLDIEMQEVGKNLLKNPVNTVGEVVEKCYEIYQNN